MINQISETTKQAILRKTPYAHGTRPSDSGMPASQVKKMFYAAIADESNSVLSEMERMRQEANAAIDNKVDSARITDEIEAHCDSYHIPSTLGLQRYADKDTNVFRIYYTDLTVSPSDWQQLPLPMGTYAYRAVISLPNITDKMVPDVTFSPDDAVRPQLATFCTTLTGGVAVYSTEALSEAVHVDNLVCYVPTYYTVLVAAAHADVTVIDTNGKQYAHGDSVAVGTILLVSMRAQEGYALSCFYVNGNYYSADALAQRPVSGTVQITATATEVTP